MSTDELVTLFAQPALAAPEGVTPDFDNPPNHNSLAWGIITVCTVVATLCMCLRIYVRVWLDRSIRLEDGKLARHPMLLGLTQFQTDNWVQ